MTNKGYNYIGETIGLCDNENCKDFIPIKIIEETGIVFYLKYCPIHGIHKRLISIDYDYYMHSVTKHITAKTPICPEINNNYDCPNKCGICSLHESDIGYIIVEITDECDIKCSTCIAASGPNNNKYRTVEQISKMIDSCIGIVGTPEILMISGGEPTMHPDFFTILKNAQNKAKRVFIISNGVKIANDISFVENLSNYSERIEIYLQFDSLNSDTLLNIRGLNLRETRLKAVENLNNCKINSTLVCICKKGINDKEINSIIDFALAYKYIRGITIQPLKFLGRGENNDIKQNYITLSEVRKEILNGNIFTSKNLIPHYFNPENICIGYYDKENKKEVTLEMQKNNLLNQSFFMTPQYSTNKYKYENLFRVAIVSFFDRFSYNTKSVKQSAICFISDEGKVIPQNTYYNFHR
jgi:uncharacterized radical SAM superfamily Fe-S cluster-containing enzyme